MGYSDHANEVNYEISRRSVLAKIWRDYRSMENKIYVRALLGLKCDAINDGMEEKRRQPFDLMASLRKLIHH